MLKNIINFVLRWSATFNGSNTSRGEVTVDVPAGFGENSKITIVEVGSGKVVRTVNNNQQIRNLDLNGLANGVYIIQITSDQNQAVQKLILNR